MPEFTETEPPATEAELQFPPVSRAHILQCSYDAWFPKYRKVCIKSRIIPLSDEFVEYLREDGILLSDENDANNGGDDDDDWEPTNPVQHYKSADEETYEGLIDDSDNNSDSDVDSADTPPRPPRLPPNRRFPALHQQIRDAIADLGGVVAPKLNWSAPKDAAELMEQKNTMRCRTPDDVYFILKSSSFVSHDLEHALADTVEGPPPPPPAAAAAAAAAGTLGFQPVLVLRAYFDLHTALEFRCFVKQRNLVALTPRDLKPYAYLDALRGPIVARAQALFRSRLQFTFPSPNFVFDIYIPEATTTTDTESESSGPPHHDTDAAGQGGTRLSWARLIDINPWAPRTDTLLFSWHELLTLSLPRPFLGIVGEGDTETLEDDDQDDDSDSSDAASTASDSDYTPELRLVDRDDPAATNFSSAPYSAHKLPKEVVDASMAGEGGLREFAQQWQQLVARGERERRSR